MVGVGSQSVRFVGRDGRVPVSNFFLLVGPSGSGKTSVINSLLSRYPEEVAFPLTYTTRQPRGGEVHGRDFFFVSRAEWLAALPEYVAYTEYNGEMYGTKTSDILDPLSQGKKVLAAFDHHGVEGCKQRNLHPVTIFLKPLSIDQLRSNLLKRWPEGGDEMEARLAKAHFELRRLGQYDYVVDSDTVAQLVADVERIMCLTTSSLAA